ncbi:hypothetical protein ACOSQ3_001032 [Xanthoceras sorbifolium]
MCHIRCDWFRVDFQKDVGRPLVRGAVHMCANFSPLMAEAIAVRRGLQLAIEFGLSSFLVESDALGVINVISWNLVPCSDMGMVLFDIYCLANSLHVSSFSFVPRLANMVANALAKVALSILSDLFWIDSCPSDVELLVQEDAPG